MDIRQIEKSVEIIRRRHKARSSAIRLLRDKPQKTPENGDGGPGSGNFGHEGRAGKIGGSAPSGSNVGGEKEKPISERVKPSLKSPANFDKYVEENGLKVMYRGYSAESEESLGELTDKAKTGEARLSGEGSSSLGQGIYFAYGKGDAEGYMETRKKQNQHESGRILTAALDKDAKLIDYDDLIKMKNGEVSELLRQAFSPSVSFEERMKIGTASQQIEGMGIREYAIQKGYDAAYGKLTDEVVVFNQKALVVRDDSKDGLLDQIFSQNGEIIRDN